MKTAKLLFIASASILIAACSSTKKTTTSAPVAAAATPTPATAATSTVSGNLSLIKSANGVYAPGNEELTAIQARYQDVTLDKLNEGHMLYTKGACVSCHGAKSIYRYGEGRWYSIIEDMARKANINDAQKDAVYKYVLAIKAVQPK